MIRIAAVFMVASLVAAATTHASLLGHTQETAAYSAKQILEAGTAAGNGLYWIDPDGGDTANAFQAYCDMTTDGGGWTLAVHSLSYDNSASTDMTANTGVASLTTGHTRNLTALAIDQDAEIRHTIVDSLPTARVFDAKYTGNYHGQMAATWSDWTALGDHSDGAQVMLDYHFGMWWSTADNDRDQSDSVNYAVQYGQPWYYRSAWRAMPTSVRYHPDGPYADGSGNPVDSYSIWVRETSTPPPPTPSIPEPSAFIIWSLLGVTGVGIAKSRRRQR